MYGDGWGDWQFQRSRIRAQPCDVIENIVDIAHFPHVHGGEVRSFENRFGDRTVTQISKVQRSANARMVVPPGLPFNMEALQEDFVSLYPQMAHAALGQDVLIWRDKIYREEPILCDGDGPITTLRRWYEQFYRPLSG